MAQAAYKKYVAVAATDANTKSDWKVVPTASPSFDFGGDVLDTTTVGLTDALAYRSRILGLNDFSASMEVLWDPTNKAALDLIRAAKTARTDLWFSYQPDGTGANGWKAKVVVESYNHSGDVGGLENVSVTLQGNGQVVAATVDLK